MRNRRCLASWARSCWERGEQEEGSAWALGAEGAGAEASFVANRMRERGILLGTDGPYHNVVKIRPPMPFTAEDGDFLVDELERALRQLPER